MSAFDPEETAETETELDWKSQAILWAIADNGGTADTGEIRSLTGIDSYSSLNYRINNKLEPTGLVDVMHPDSADGGTPAKVITLTQDGQELANQISPRQSDSGTVSVTDRMEQLESNVNALETRLDEIAEAESDASEEDAASEQFQDRFDELGAQLEALEDDMEVLFTAMTAYDAIFESVFEIETDQFRSDTDTDQRRSVEQIRKEVHTLLAETGDHDWQQ